MVDLNVWNKEVAYPKAFAGGTTNARGDNDGTSDPKTLFTTTGTVLVRIFGVCTTTLTGAAGTIEVGVAGNTAALIAQETGTEIVANAIYASATQVTGALAFSSVPGPFVVANGLSIIETVGTADITAGNIYYVCLWLPLSENGKVSAAGAAGF